MKRKILIGFAIAAATAGILALFSWRFLETYPRQRWNPPSHEARVNEYLALDRWLQAIDRPVRVLRSGNLATISRAEERQIFVQASLFTWTRGTAAMLIRWVEEGGTLFLVLDHQADWEFWDNTALLSLLDEFGIEIQMRGIAGQRHNSGAPAFERGFSFEVLHDEYALAVEDLFGLIRLVQVERGMGRFIVSGGTRFLRSTFIGTTPNTRLAWTLFAADSAPDLRADTASGSERGWLFIRGTTRTRGLLGSLFRHGNLITAVVAAAVLLVIGFWAVIPMFGLVRRDDTRPGKPLSERFIAEGRFLKTYGALGFYRDTYIKEIRRHLVKKENLSKESFSTDEAMIGHLLAILGKTTEDREGKILVSALRKESIKYRDFPKMISIFKTILERI